MFLKNNCLFLWLFVVALGALACIGAAYGADGPFARDTVMVAPPQPIKVPQFDFTNLHGGTLKSSEMKGKVIVIRFWATWWDICRSEMPSVQKAHKEYPAKDVVVMTISLDGGDGTSVKKFLDVHQYTMPSAHDKGMAFARKIEARGVPMTYIVDRNQNIVARGMGPLDLERSDVKKLIQTLVAKSQNWGTNLTKEKCMTHYLHLLKRLLAGVAFALATQSAYALQVGDKAPDFSLPSSSSGTVSLSDFEGKKSLIVFFYIGAFTKTWTQEALAFQLDLPKFEAVNAQVLGVSVDFPDANRAFAEKLGLTYPLLSDRARKMSRAYESIFDDAAMANTSRISVYLRAKRAWFVIDKEGIIRYMKVGSKQFVPSDELIEVVKKYQ